MDRATRQGVALRESSSQTRRGNVRKTVGEHETVATASELNNIVRGTEGTCFSHCVERLPAPPVPCAAPKSQPAPR